MEHDTTTTKVCTCCKQTKLKYVDFAMVNKKNRPNPQVRPQCRQCRSKVEMERRYKNREAWLAKQAQWRNDNKDKIKQYHLEKKDENLLRFKEYRENNKQKMKDYKVAYNSKPENKSKRNQREKDRKKVDHAYRIMCNVRTRIHNVLKKNKNNHTDVLLGCNKQQLVQWLTYQLQGELSWDNYGTHWHVDHVIPLGFVDLLDNKQQKIAFCWSNLRPCLVEENLDKKDKIIKSCILEHIHTYDTFIKNNSGYPSDISNCWCMRISSYKGDKSQDDGDFESFLKWIISNDGISIEDPTSND